MRWTLLLPAALRLSVPHTLLSRSTSAKQLSTVAMPSVEVEQFRALNDNYAFLVHDASTGATMAIDTPEVSPIMDVLNRQVSTLSIDGGGLVAISTETLHMQSLRLRLLLRPDKGGGWHCPAPLASLVQTAPAIILSSPLGHFAHAGIYGCLLLQARLEAFPRAEHSPPSRSCRGQLGAKAPHRLQNHRTGRRPIAFSL
eukprot:6197198-Pleurochrysis_carterae.AAC.1